MVYMFNELSLMKVNSREVACNLLETFVRSYIVAESLGFDEIRVHENSLANLYKLPLADGYNIDNWLRDERINENLRIRFREIVTTFPLLTNDELKQNDVYLTSEFYKDFEGQKKEVWGLGAAYIYDTLAISLRTHVEWGKSEIEIIHYYLNDNLEEITENVFTKNISNEDTIRTHEALWNKTQANRLKESRELWERREEFFPNLILCPEVEYHLNGIGVSKKLSQIINRLRVLNEYVRNWHNGNFNYHDVNANTNLNISPESKSTLRKFGSSRKFSVPGRGKEIFDLHVKTGDLRFHFYPDNDNRAVYIGYIGRHLRISSED